MYLRNIFLKKTEVYYNVISKAIIIRFYNNLYFAN